MLLAIGLIPVSVYGQLLFHTLVELFAVCIAFISFVVAWNTYPFSRNHYLMVLGIGYFWVGVLDMAHAMTFQGMPFFADHHGSLSIQLWVIARYFEAILLVIAPVFISKAIRRKRIFLLMALISVCLLWLTSQEWMPDMYVKGEGLTNTKIFSEYIIMSLLVVSMLLLWRQRVKLDQRSLMLIYLSIVLTIAAELSFTLYTNLHGSMLIVGHFLKLFSFWAIYVALIESSLKEPFRSLSREANTYDAVPDETVVVDAGGIVRQVNHAVRQSTGLSTNTCLGMHCHDLQHCPKTPIEDCVICQHIEKKQPLKSHQFYCVIRLQWYEVTLTNIHYSGEMAGMVHVRRNITESKEAQERFISLNRLYTVHSHTNRAIVRAHSREQMFQSICDITISKGGFKMAWIGIINGDVVKPQTFAGDEDGYLQAMEMRVDDSDLANGPIGRAAKSQAVNYVNDTNIDPSFKPWREAAGQRGYRALAAVPLNFQGRVIGIFTIYSEHPNVFEEKMTELLTSLGEDISAALFHIDQEERRLKAERKLHQLSQAVEQSANATIITNIQSEIVYVNRSFTTLTGYYPQEVLGKKPNILRSENTTDETSNDIRETLRAGKEWNGELQYKTKGGKLYWAKQSIFPIIDESGQLTQFVSTSEDISELHEAQETIQKLAFYDPLTNLPNRRLLADRLQLAIQNVKHHQDLSLAVMVFDLDNFKNVNDSLGHSYGDKLLQHVAHVLQKQIQPEDTVSRQGGDEFTIVLNGLTSTERVIQTASNIIDVLAKPVELSGHQVVVGTSIGIALYPHDANSSDRLLRNADMAMYHAKSEGKNNFQFYREEINAKAHHRLMMESKLRLAIQRNEFELYYQPQTDFQTGELIGLEALIRWKDKEGTLIPPDAFIPLAEETGMIGKIGDWVIQQACEDNRTLQNAGFPSVKVAVNVSAYQFRQGQHLYAVIHKALRDSGLAPEHLSLELTESTLIENIEDTLVELALLKSLKITIAIDDFGTGYSSLSYLKQFPVDILKIDQSFIYDLLTDSSDKAIVTAIIAMGHQLNLTVLAEGVETLEQHQFLVEKGCDFAQGFYYCKPKSMEALLTSKWIRQIKKTSQCELETSE